LTAASGFVVFAVKHRIHFETWGGVGGWYAWGWFPWVFAAVEEHFEVRTKSLGRLLALAGVSLLVVFNVVWWIEAHRLYGL
jgi:hypothetical protein